MPDKPRVDATASTSESLSESTLDTSRLIVEFLHAAYATRHEDDAAETAAADGSSETAAERHGRLPVAVSTHAVRAAIHVYQHGERTVGQLASGLGISYGWASRVADELEAAHYVVRERDTDDRRVVRVRLNPDARNEVERAYRWRAEAVQQALEPLSDSERESVRTFLRRVTELLRAGADHNTEAPIGR
jgi:DNA-binding MarR family transcriptional regulator